MAQTGKMKLERGERGTWDTATWRLIQPNGFPVADIVDALHPEDQESYAHEILAAVNHCEGYTDEQLEAVSLRDIHETIKMFMESLGGVDLHNAARFALNVKALLHKLEPLEDCS